MGSLCVLQNMQIVWLDCPLVWRGMNSCLTVQGVQYPASAGKASSSPLILKWISVREWLDVWTYIICPCTYVTVSCYYICTIVHMLDFFLKIFLLVSFNTMLRQKESRDSLVCPVLWTDNKEIKSWRLGFPVNIQMMQKSLGRKGYKQNRALWH